jgi:hypothetical protein
MRQSDGNVASSQQTLSHCHLPTLLVATACMYTVRKLFGVKTVQQTGGLSPRRTGLDLRVQGGIGGGQSGIVTRLSASTAVSFILICLIIGSESIAKRAISIKIILHFLAIQQTHHLVRRLRVAQPVKEFFHFHFRDTRITSSCSVELVPVRMYTCSVLALKYVSEVPTLSYSLAVHQTPVH